MFGKVLSAGKLGAVLSQWVLQQHMMADKQPAFGFAACQLYADCVESGRPPNYVR